MHLLRDCSNLCLRERPGGVPRQVRCLVVQLDLERPARVQHASPDRLDAIVLQRCSYKRSGLRLLQFCLRCSVKPELARVSVGDTPELAHDLCRKDKRLFLRQRIPLARQRLTLRVRQQLFRRLRLGRQLRDPLGVRLMVVYELAAIHQASASGDRALSGLGSQLRQHPRAGEGVDISLLGSHRASGVQCAAAAVAGRLSRTSG